MPESSTANQQVEGLAFVSARAKELEAPLDFDLENVRIEPLSRNHKRAAFLCREAKIQNFCRNNARQHNDNFLIRAFVACAPDSVEVLGFYYLSLTSYKIGDGDGTVQLDAASDEKFERVHAVPAVYLGMIGVHTPYERRGIGKVLMLDAIQRTVKIAQHAGLYALTLDAVSEDIAKYYAENFDFRTFQAGKNGLEMFLPLKTILAGLPTAS